MAERDDPEKLSYMNNSGECRFCDEKNLEWRFAVITCHMSAQTMMKYNKMKVDRGLCVEQYSRPYKDDKIHDCRGLWKCKRCGEEGMFNLSMPDGEIWQYKAERDGTGWTGKEHNHKRKIECYNCGEVFLSDKGEPPELYSEELCEKCEAEVAAHAKNFEERSIEEQVNSEEEVDLDVCEHCESENHGSDACPDNIGDYGDYRGESKND